MRLTDFKIMKMLMTTVATLVVTLTATAKLNVVATTPDLGAIAREIGGDKVDVFTLAKPTEDPHFVDAKPSFVVKLNRADALLEGGAELESTWLDPLLQQARNARLATGKPGRIQCNRGITMLEVPAVLDRSKGDEHASGNPHYTTDPANGRIVAATVAEAFSALDARSAETFKANLARFNQRLDAKVSDWKKALAPYAGRRIVSYHNSWPYFAKRFDLRFDLFLEPKPGIPPSPSHLAQVIATMKSENIRIVVCQPHLNHRSAELVASRSGGIVLDFASYPGGKGMPDDYAGWMDSLVQNLARAFNQTK
jgi:zinc/manganese transport system substrate-binding protein